MQKIVVSKETGEGFYVPWEIEQKIDCSRSIDEIRTDPIFVKWVEQHPIDEYGDNQGLGVVEIPDGVEWEIEECNGFEWVVEKHRKWYP